MWIDREFFEKEREGSSGGVAAGEENVDELVADDCMVELACMREV